jgi:hypothetical protein
MHGVNTHNMLDPLHVIHVEPVMHHAIFEILQWNQIAFVIGNYHWEVGFQITFGTQLVTFHSTFASHIVPTALNMARDICGTLGFWDPAFQGSLIEPLEDPYYFQQIHTPPTQVSFTL